MGSSRVDPTDWPNAAVGAVPFLVRVPEHYVHGGGPGRGIALSRRLGRSHPRTDSETAGNDRDHANRTGSGQEPDRAIGHRRSGDGKIEPMPEYAIPEPNPAGSVYTTPRDLAKWLQFQLGDGTWHGKRIVSAAGLRETQTPQTIIPLAGIAQVINPHTHFLNYAMGWIAQDYRGVAILSHSGWIDGFRVQLVLIPEKKIAFAILANLDGTRMNLAIGNRLIDLLLNFPETDWNAYYGNLMQTERRGGADAVSQERERGRNRDEKPSLPLVGVCRANTNIPLTAHAKSR